MNLTFNISQFTIISHLSFNSAALLLPKMKIVNGELKIASIKEVA